MSNNHTNCAFTLSEVLVTVMIIGIIAGLTIPAIINSYQKNLTVNKLKKVYSQLIEAIKLAEIDYGDMSTWNLNLSAREIGNRYLKNYLKIDNKKNALQVNSNLNYKYMNGKIYSNAVLSSSNSAVITLIDGSLIFIDSWRPEDASFVTIYVDINGYKPPNTIGKDTFRLVLNKNLKTIGPEPSRGDCVNTGESCIKKIIEDGWQIKYKF